MKRLIVTFLVLIAFAYASTQDYDDAVLVLPYTTQDYHYVN